MYKAGVLCSEGGQMTKEVSNFIARLYPAPEERYRYHLSRYSRIWSAERASACTNFLASRARAISNARCSFIFFIFFVCIARFSLSSCDGKTSNFVNDEFNSCVNDTKILYKTA